LRDGRLGIGLADQEAADAQGQGQRLQPAAGALYGPGGLATGAGREDGGHRGSWLEKGVAAPGGYQPPRGTVLLLAIILTTAPVMSNRIARFFAFLPPARWI